MLHQVKKPFMCWEGQFTPGQRDLCFGVAETALKGHKFHRAKVGNKVYEVESETALALAEDKNAFSHGKAGRTAIIPLKICKEVEND